MDEVARALAASPGRTPAELRDVLRAGGRVSITAADVTTVLRSHPTRFRSEGPEPLRWWPGGPAPGPRPPAEPPAVGGPPPLYAWQAEALAAWEGCGGRGVVEAVTGTGKTLLGLLAARQELARGGQACVLVPTTELLSQWRAVLDRHLPPGASVGLLGGGHDDRLGDHDVLVAVVNSARHLDLRPRRPGGLLVGDECHRYGTDANRDALPAAFARRLGLSATFARTDDGHLAWLTPYFGPVCFTMGYRRAVADGVAARFVVALLGVAFTEEERLAYDDLSFQLRQARAVLVSRFGLPAEPVGAFLQAVATAARRGDEGDGPTVTARSYLRAMQDRRQLLAETPAKDVALARLAPTLGAAGRALVFTQTIDSAERAAAGLRDAGLAAAAVHSGLAPPARRLALHGFREGRVQVVTAPQVLDEGIDVPAADLAVILASSRSRRQMVQRMGRVLRPKPDGARARFVVIQVAGTVEDPALGAHAGFLEEITDVADELRAFPPGWARDEVDGFLSGSPGRPGR